MRLNNLPILLSIFAGLISIPLTLLAVKTNQDNRSQAMIERPPLPTIPPLTVPSPTP